MIRSTEPLDKSVDPDTAAAIHRLPMTPTYFRITLRELGITPARRAALLRGTGVTEPLLADPAAEITIGAQLALTQNAMRIAAPGWSLDVGRRFDLGAQGALGFAMVSAPTLGASFDTMARYGHVRSPWFRLRVERDARHWRMVVQRQIRIDPDIDVVLLEPVLLSAQVLVESVLGRAMREGAMTCDYPTPPWADRYPEVFSCRVSFGAKHPSIRLPIEWLDLACPLADAAMHQLALGRLETERRRLESGNHLEARIEALFAAAGDAGLSLTALAERLNMSRRTLLRRLRGSGASFGDLLDRHRMTRAEGLLANPAYSASEISYRLGYSDPANFARAFRRWYGKTPGNYRRGINQK